MYLQAVEWINKSSCFFSGHPLCATHYTFSPHSLSLARTMSAFSSAPTMPQKTPSSSPNMRSIFIVFNAEPPGCVFRNRHLQPEDVLSHRSPPSSKLCLSSHVFDASSRIRCSLAMLHSPKSLGLRSNRRRMATSSSTEKLKSSKTLPKAISFVVGKNGRCIDISRRQLPLFH